MSIAGEMVYSRPTQRTYRCRRQLLAPHRARKLNPNTGRDTPQTRSLFCKQARTYERVRIGERRYHRPRRSRQTRPAG